MVKKNILVSRFEINVLLLDLANFLIVKIIEEVKDYFSLCRRILYPLDIEYLLYNMVKLTKIFGKKAHIHLKPLYL